MKTAELTGPALDYAVALAEGYTNLRVGVFSRVLIMDPPGSSQCSVAFHDLLFCDSQAGDDIIDRERISTVWNDEWVATCWVDLKGMYSAEGTTRREAAMRCYVASKLGAEVDIPKELQ